jgi:hypothetical protein
MKNHVGGAVLIVIGGIFLLDNLGFADIHVGQIVAKWWPVILIVVGVRMLMRGERRG